MIYFIVAQLQSPQVPPLPRRMKIQLGELSAYRKHMQCLSCLVCTYFELIGSEKLRHICGKPWLGTEVGSCLPVHLHLQLHLPHLPHHLIHLHQ